MLAPRILNDVSYVTRINHEMHFAWQAQYLVKLECDFSWQAQHFQDGLTGLIPDTGLIWLDNHCATAPASYMRLVGAKLAPMTQMLLLSSSTQGC